MTERVIAIDGPAASGKSTVAARVARHFGFPYVNTGNLFRAVTLAALQRHPHRSLSKLSEADWQELLSYLKLEYRPLADGAFDLSVNGTRPGEELRSPEVAREVSVAAALPLVRDFVLAAERRLAQNGWIVMEGRDIGTAVFPNADYKFFITASPLERARRRLAQAGEVPADATLESVAAEIARRDHLDSTRKVAPLLAAPDAVKLDTTGLAVDEVVDAIVKRVEEHGLA